MGYNDTNGVKMAGNWGKWWTSGTKNWKWGPNMFFYWQIDGKLCKSRGIR